VPPIIRQQVQPAFMHAATQSQQPWIMSQQALSPLVQVTQQPSLVISTLHAPIVRLQQQTVIPFIMQHRLHIPPAIMAQRFCIMAQAVGSSQLHVTFIPPAHFSTFMVQRGTMTMFGVVIVGVPIGIPVFIPAIAARSIIIAVATGRPSVWSRVPDGLPAGPRNGSKKPARELISPTARVELPYKLDQLGRVETRPLSNSRAKAMFQHRLRHLLSPELTNRFGGGCPVAFVPVAVPAAQLGWVQEVYRMAAEQAQTQLAPPRHLRPSYFSAN